MNPVFSLDFFSFCTRPRFFVIRAIAPGSALLGIILVMLSGLPFTAAPDQVGHVIFWFSSMPLLLAVLCIAPALFSPLIVNERHGRTLEILRSSPLPLRALLLGKWGSRLALLGFACVAALPMVASALLYGGVRMSQFAEFLVILAASVLWSSALSLFIGSRTQDVGAAMRWSYLLMFVVCFGTLLLGMLFARGSVAWAYELLHGVNPLVVLVGIYDGTGQAAPFGIAQPWFYALWSLGLMAVFLWLSYRAVACEPRSVRASGSAVRRAVSGLLLGERTLESRPLLWMELGGFSRARRPLLGWLTIGMVIVLEGFFALNLIETLTSPRNATFGPGMPQSLSLPLQLSYVYVAAGWGLLVIAVSGAMAFQTQRDSSAMDVLNTAPLATKEIVHAKALGTLWRGMPWLVLSVLHAVLAAITQAIPPLSALAYAVCLVLVAWLVGGFAIMTGARSRTSSGAVASTIGILLGVGFGAGVGLAILAVILGAWSGAQLILAFHPGYYLAMPMVLGFLEARVVFVGACGMVAASLLYLFLGWHFAKREAVRLYTLRRDYGWFDLHGSPAAFYRQRRTTSPDLPSSAQATPIAQTEHVAAQVASAATPAAPLAPSPASQDGGTA